ncbi:RNA pseudouridylate synthase RluCD-like protein [Psychroflexus torquis ATCC 700755]|uniref:RNA pseudouridylate synthase RluCD-like protein n=1 Tax=Psychroflexus torquis (strain ATCC 700755 / CIP 106069 / ACAM 623) TaxID=313595 RepID=K4IJH1_PSYTT|nr:RNA pseudouridine synthase [Psychroflexus torquis]AFU69968.1 RNA pseudouridylate synthase RluCD-like protein [Psychroflexus torquis ATCC 700755]
MNSTPKNLQVIFEDNHLIVINKRPGDIVQGDKTGDLPLSEVVKLYLKEKYNKPGEAYLGVVHRLDRPTSGVVVFSKTSKALSRLNKAFADRDTHKVYWAVVKNKPKPESARLVHYLKRNTKQNKSYAHIKPVEDSKEAVLSYQKIQSLDNYHVLEITLETGRHHQIRSQLSAIGCPIKGDLKYGFDRSNKNASIHLHSKKLTITHPVRKEDISFEAKLPDDVIWNSCKV